MRQYISKEAYESLCDAIDEGRRIDRKIANQVAQGMKTWAMETRSNRTTRTGSSR
ncbi:MAG: glutamine synthetase III [Alistipes indistinctus]